MSTSTYSFSDSTVVFSHALFGQYVANGTGLGGITTAMSTDRSAQDVSADGSVMVSKIKARNGTASVSTQQTSELNHWLTRLYNYLEIAPTDQWASMVITIRAPRMREQETLTGVSFQKLPDVPRQAQGQQITWLLMAADVQRDVI
ncbi:phage protein [Paenibacillus sp. 2RAB27]|uniref:phage protein n=1 Tax=Paenibacillus sp. 2RAB27 TaxID=3232991 RepID=UPI003F9DC228